METDLERYAWLVAYELREARSSATPKERREHEGLARAYMLKMHALENDPQVFLLGDNEDQRALKPLPEPRDDESSNVVDLKPGGDRHT
ncbi:hypothetical protein [Allosphingosinicella sp.]|uniref:hypothetical protein n=1 Tax=Allosphingosinicella sp. TaxID=2823234 RepID=UPI002FC1C506